MNYLRELWGILGTFAPYPVHGLQPVRPFRFARTRSSSREQPGAAGSSREQPGAAPQQQPRSTPAGLR